MISLFGGVPLTLEYLNGGVMQSPSEGYVSGDIWKEMHLQILSFCVYLL